MWNWMDQVFLVEFTFINWKLKVFLKLKNYSFWSSLVIRKLKMCTDSKTGVMVLLIIGVIYFIPMLVMLIHFILKEGKNKTRTKDWINHKLRELFLLASATSQIKINDLKNPALLRLGLYYKITNQFISASNSDIRRHNVRA